MKTTKDKIGEILMNYIRLTNLRGKEKPLVRRGLRNEAIEQIMTLLETLLREEREYIDIKIRKLSGQWEGQTTEWIEGNKKAFRDILFFIKN